MKRESTAQRPNMGVQIYQIFLNTIDLTGTDREHLHLSLLYGCFGIIHDNFGTSRSDSLELSDIAYPYDT